jgi:hypothetical protein
MAKEKGNSEEKGQVKCDRIKKKIFKDVEEFKENEF